MKRQKENTNVSEQQRQEAAPILLAVDQRKRLELLKLRNFEEVEF